MMTTVTLLTAVTLMFSASTLLVSCSGGGDTPEKVNPTPTPTTPTNPTPDNPTQPDQPTNPDQPTQPDQPTVPTLPENVEIVLNASAGQFKAATRAGTRYETTDLTNGLFCKAYLDNTTTSYLSSLVVWNNPNWRFNDGIHYWPISGNLDFLAYYPASIPDYITNMDGDAQKITYTVDDLLQFKCSSLPATPSGQNELKEFIYAYTPDQNRVNNAASGVDLSFKHPFAQITFKNGRASSLKITNVTFEDIKNNGTFSYKNTPKWTTSGGDVDFEASYSAGYADTDVITLGGPYLVVPQTKDPLTISVTYTSKDWGGPGEKESKTSTATISINWQPGYSYFYTFNIVDGDLKVNTEIFTEQW